MSSSGLLGRSIPTAYIYDRGGQALLGEVAYTSMSFSRRLNQQATAQIVVVKGTTSFLGDLRGYRHELIVGRDGQAAWAGPLVKPQWATDVVTLPAQDLGLGWLAVRDVINDRFLPDHDVTRIAETLVTDTLNVDNSQRLEVLAHPSGLASSEEYRRVQHTKVADALNSLASKGLQYTTLVRQLMLGPFDTEPFVLTDDTLRSPSVTEGDLATSVSTVGAQTAGVGNPVEGHAGGVSSSLGLVEKTINDGSLLSVADVQRVATMEHNASSPAPLFVSGVLAPSAPVEFEDLWCGRSVVVKLAGTDRVVDETLRLLTVDVTVTPSEQGLQEEIAVTLGPIGV